MVDKQILTQKDSRNVVYNKVMPAQAGASNRNY